MDVFVSGTVNMAVTVISCETCNNDSLLNMKKNINNGSESL